MTVNSLSYSSNLQQLVEKGCDGWGFFACFCGGDLCVCGADGETCPGCPDCEECDPEDEDTELVYE